MTLELLRKEKIVLRKIDPEKATLYGIIYDNALAIAKKELREPTDNDIILAAKQQLGKIEKAIIEIKEHNGDTSTYEKQISELQFIIPPSLSEEDTKKEVIRVLKEIIPFDKGQVMKKLKEVPNIDMKLANKILGELK